MYFLIQNPKNDNSSSYKFAIEHQCWERMYRTNLDLVEWTKFFNIRLDKKERPL